jgi:HK97 family phage portal protein
VRPIVGVILRAIDSTLSAVRSAWSWPMAVFESFTGAWQRNIVVDGTKESLLRNSAVYACVTGIAGDIAKMRLMLSEIGEDGIWTETKRNLPWLPVLRRPNHYQTPLQFVRQWGLSRLLHGNGYVLKGRDQRGVVARMYVLDPTRVIPLVAETGDVYYELKRDTLSRTDDIDSPMPDRIVVPAREIIHDTEATLWHPLIGVSPLYACALAAMLGSSIVQDSADFFANRSLPSGILTAPGAIKKETAERLKEEFEAGFSGRNLGRLAVLGDGLKFEAMRMTAEHAQLAEQLGWTVEDIARAFHYPMFKLGGPVPQYAKGVEALPTQGLTAGLELPSRYGIEFDLDDLMRMDTATLYQANSEGVKGGWMDPNRARWRANMPAIEGGSTAYMQEQNYSLAALSKRDAREDPWQRGDGGPPPPPPVREIRSKLLDRLRSAA